MKSLLLTVEMKSSSKTLGRADGGRLCLLELLQGKLRMPQVLQQLVVPGGQALELGPQLLVLPQLGGELHISTRMTLPSRTCHHFQIGKSALYFCHNSFECVNSGSANLRVPFLQQVTSRHLLS